MRTGPDRVVQPCLVEQVRTGGDRNFGYLAADRAAGRGALVDPSHAPEKLLRRAAELRVAVAYIFVTHGHYDHTEGVSRAEQATGLRRLLLGTRDPASGVTVAHGARFPLGGIEIQVLHTPGHTEDSICLLAGDALFTGDTLFVGKVGGTDLGAGARRQFESLRGVVLANPFLLRTDFASFRDLKENWAACKRGHGIA